MQLRRRLLGWRKAFWRRALGNPWLKEVWAEAPSAYRSDSIRGTQTGIDLSALPDLDDNLKPIQGNYLSIMHEVWESQTLHNQLYGDMMTWLTDPEAYQHMAEEQRDRQAWVDAVRWIKEKHAPEPPEPVTFNWNWPNPDVSQSPKPLGVGDLEDGWEDD